MNIPELLSSTYYKIPNYQRGYSWEEKQWLEFLEDIQQHPNGRLQYLGVFTLQKRDGDHRFFVVDGQQRLTTLLILVATLVRRLPQDPENAINTLLNGLLCDENQRLRLTYQQDHDEHTGDTGVLRALLLPQYRDQGLNNPYANVPHASIYSRRLIQAAAYFYRKLGALQELQLNDLARRITELIQVETHTIEEWQAFVVFEQMNNRGKTLSLMELMKNRLLYLSARLGQPENLGELINTTWHTVYATLGRFDIVAGASQSDSDTEFLRDHWIMRWGRVRDRADACRFHLLEITFTPRRLEREVIAQDDQGQAEELLRPLLFTPEQINQPGRVLRRLQFALAERNRTNGFLLQFFEDLQRSVSAQEGATIGERLNNCDADELRSCLANGLNSVLRTHFDQWEDAGLTDDQRRRCLEEAGGLQPRAIRCFLESYLNNNDSANSYVQRLNTDTLTPEEITNYCKEVGACISCWFAIHQRIGIEAMLTLQTRQRNPDRVTQLGEWLSRLRIIGRRDAHPLMLAALLRLQRDPMPARFTETVSLLKCLERMAFLDSIAGLGMSKDVVQALARRLYSEELSVQQVCDQIDLELGTPRTIYEAFRDHVGRRKERGGFYRQPGIRYLLYEYEWALQAQPDGNQVVGIAREAYNGAADIAAKDEYGQPMLEIEHVFPQNPGEPRDIAAYWPEFAERTREQQNQLLHSLGNLVFVNDEMNRTVGNRPYIVPEGALPLPNDYQPKRETYAIAGGCLAARRIAEDNPQWTPRAILSRGIKLLESVEERWGVYLGTPADKRALLNLDFVQDHLPLDNRLWANMTALQFQNRLLELFETDRSIPDTLTNWLVGLPDMLTIGDLVARLAQDAWFFEPRANADRQDNRKLLLQDVIVAILKKDGAALHLLFPEGGIGGPGPVGPAPAAVMQWDAILRATLDGGRWEIRGTRCKMVHHLGFRAVIAQCAGRENNPRLQLFVPDNGNMTLEFYSNGNAPEALRNRMGALIRSLRTELIASLTVQEVSVVPADDAGAIVARILHNRVRGTLDPCELRSVQEAFSEIANQVFAQVTDWLTTARTILQA